MRERMFGRSTLVGNALPPTAPPGGNPRERGVHGGKPGGPADTAHQLPEPTIKGRAARRFYPSFPVFWSRKNESSPMPADTPPRLHADRAAGGDSDHRHPHRPPFTRCAKGPRSGLADEVPEQPQATGAGDAQ